MRPGRWNYGLLLAGAMLLLGVLAGPVASAVAAPTLTIETPASGTTTSDRTPLFAGSTSDVLDPVTVNIFAGDTRVAGGEATPSFLTGEWSTHPSTDLADGSYTAVAEQTEGLTGETGESSPIAFTVHASKPSVTLNAVSSPTGDATPSFSGTASENTDVTVYVFGGSSAQGEVLAEAHASGNGGGWTSGGASPALADGTYTAVAEQEGEFGNGKGFSQERTFTVHTAKPTVTLNQPASPTNDTTPSFSGSASEKTSVTVYIFKAGSVVAEAHATGTGGGWTSGGASPGLADGTYTAVAEQESAFGNGPGLSQERTFTVDTAPPDVTLNAISTPTNDATPSFSGTASDTTSVTVYIFKGGSASGSPVSAAHASGTGGSWSSGGASPALGDGGYTAVAVQDSSGGNGEGKSGEIHFTVDTAPPAVTLNGIASPTNDTTPSFSGFAADTTTVTVYVFKGSSAMGSPVAAASAGGTGGGWASGGASPALSDGAYTAVAVQESSLGNADGTSEAIHFTIQTAAPKVTLNGVKSPSGNTIPAFSGTGSDTTSVSILIYAGATATGGVVSSAAATGTGGGWSSGHASPALPTGQYTAVAVQESSLLGNPSGVSNEVTFVVDTSSPTVTLNSVPTPSNDTTPSFSGTASDSTQVVVHVLNSASQEVASATASPSGGGWKAGSVSKTLTTGSYTAVATESSSLGNPPGTSNS
ncbi:MAG: Ig-like domain repeat protein, partial [Solirubrobacterales bacterium]|nr:Ig-like domain repeat protein [Solirubrobacterales bacterium]